MEGFLDADVVRGVSYAILVLLRLALFAVALALTLISFQAYNQKGGERLESAFIGFAFVSMGVAVSALNSQTMAPMREDQLLFYLFQTAETVPFLIGLGLLLASLYR